MGGSADLLGGIDPDDLEITISTLKAVASDMTLLRSLPFKALRQALGPLAEELLGASNQRGRGGARNSKQGGTRIGGLSPEERLKQAQLAKREEEARRRVTERDAREARRRGGQQPPAAENHRKEVSAAVLPSIKHQIN